MKKFLKKYRHAISLLAVILLAVAVIGLGAPVATGLLIIGLWQLLQFAVSKPRPGVFFTAALTTDQVEEFQDILRTLKADMPDMKKSKERFDVLEKCHDELRNEVRKLRKAGLGGQTGVRWLGDTPYVTDDCAKALTSVFVLDCSKLKNGLETMIPDESRRKQLLAFASANLGMDVQLRAGGALSTSDIPLPTIYMPQIVELVFAYGQARKFATVFPLGSGLVKLPRLKVGGDDFGYLGAGTVGQSQKVPQKEVQAELVTFTANKAGGLIRIPYELEEDTFIPIGQFLARYIARQFAKLEDKTIFLADGSSTYANQSGVATYCAANTAYQLTLAAGKTKPSDAALNDFRTLRSKVSAAVLGNMAANGKTAGAYYLHPTWEPVLRGFNTYPNFVVFEYVQGVPMLDGWPVRWIGVSQSYQTIAAPSQPLAFFGDLSFWYLAERGTPRIEVSREVFFATDEIAMRALERIDVEAMAVDAMATLATAAS
jgi:HK97 family phage major capsid protein